MGIGDVLGKVGKVAGELAGPVLGGEEFAQNELGKQAENRAETRKREDAGIAAQAAQIEQALSVEQDPARRQQLTDALINLYPKPEHAPALMERLRKIIHPQGMKAGTPAPSKTGPMSESLGLPAGTPPPASPLAQLLGGTPPPVRGVKTGTFDISGADLEGQHDVFGNPTDPKKSYRAETDANGRIIGLVPSQPRTSGVPRVLPPISMPAAKKMAEMGIAFSDEEGNPIDVTQFDDTMQIVPVKMGAHTTYVVTSQKQTHLTVGNVVYAVPTLEQTTLADQGVALGPARVGTTSSREAIAVGPGGEAVKQTLGSSTAPVTTGVQGGNKPVAQALQPPVAPNKPGMAPKPKKAPSAAPAAPSAPAQATPAPTGKATGAKPAYMTPAMYNQQLQVARPVRVAANQIFGDPSQPEFQSLSTYGDVMNDPAAVSRIGAAARLMIDDLASVEATKSGGITTLIETSGGVPQALAAAQSEATRQAMAGLKPREQELLNAEMDAYGAIIGLRAITKGSSARFSAKSLEREVPIPGISAFNAFAFYDKLSRLAEEVWSGGKGISEQVLPEKNYYQGKYQELLKLKEQFKPKQVQKALTPPTAGASAPATAPKKWSKSKWLAAHPGGNIDAATAEAKRLGREVVD